MNDLAVSRKGRLDALEAQIRVNYEAFVRTGFALLEIRDDELYKEDGFKTWTDYLKDRVGQEFGIEERQCQRLMLCAQVRGKLPEANPSPGTDSPGGGDGDWSQKELLEFARLAPRKAEKGQPYDVGRLDRRDVNRVVKNVEAHCKETGEGRTVQVVRKAVDEELGIDRAARARETKRRREEESHVELEKYLGDMVGGLQGRLGQLETIGDDAWRHSLPRGSRMLERLQEAHVRLGEVLARAQAARKARGK
jgi:hypothetical protein